MESTEPSDTRRARREAVEQTLFDVETTLVVAARRKRFLHSYEEQLKIDIGELLEYQHLQFKAHNVFCEDSLKGRRYTNVVSFVRIACAPWQAEVLKHSITSLLELIAITDIKVAEYSVETDLVPVPQPITLAEMLFHLSKANPRAS